jgi:hypothetical protein
VYKFGQTRAFLPEESTDNVRLKRLQIATEHALRYLEIVELDDEMGRLHLAGDSLVLSFLAQSRCLTFFFSCFTALLEDAV